jgi:hypothetical protein
VQLLKLSVDSAVVPLSERPHAVCCESSPHVGACSGVQTLRSTHVTHTIR